MGEKGGAFVMTTPLSPCTITKPYSTTGPPKSALMTLSSILTIQNRLCVYCARESNLI